MDLKDLVISLSMYFEKSVLLVLPFFTCIAILQLLARFAERLGIVDSPGKRKLHEGSVPLVGGLAMYFAFAISCVILALQANVLYLLLLMLILTILGYFDDKKGLSVSLRLVVQITVTLGAIYLADMRIQHIGNVFGFGVLELNPALAVVFTVICAVGVINAINMVDGVDGLAGSLLLVSFMTLGAAALLQSQFHSAKILLICSGTLLGFLMFNARIFVRRAYVFMGDSGSMALGLLFVWFLMKLSQPPSHALSAISAGWIFGLPLMDAVVVIVRRIVRHESPLAAGRDHFHHLLMDRGFSTNKTVAILGGIHCVLAMVGLWLNSHRQFEPQFFWLFVAIVLMHFFITPRLFNRSPANAQ